MVRPMLRPTNFASLPLLFIPLLLPAQNAQLSSLAERLDRLEQENRALSDQVKELRAELAALRTQSETNQITEAGQIELQQRRIDEQQQSKVEASQKFPIRLAGMALFNTFLDSKQNGGVDYPVVASAPSSGRAGASIRQSII